MASCSICPMYYLAMFDFWSSLNASQIIVIWPYKSIKLCLGPQTALTLIGKKAFFYKGHACILTSWGNNSKVASINMSFIVKFFLVVIISRDRKKHIFQITSSDLLYDSATRALRNGIHVPNHQLEAISLQRNLRRIKGLLPGNLLDWFCSKT